LSDSACCVARSHRPGALSHTAEPGQKTLILREPPRSARREPFPEEPDSGTAVSSNKAPESRQDWGSWQRSPTNTGGHTGTPMCPRTPGYSVRRNSISPLSSRQRWRAGGRSSATSQLARAFAFISRSTSTYTMVVLSETWPSQARIVLMSTCRVNRRNSDAKTEESIPIAFPDDRA
jgi:hypothetical protein